MITFIKTLFSAKKTAKEKKLLEGKIRKLNLKISELEESKEQIWRNYKELHNKQYHDLSQVKKEWEEAMGLNVEKLEHNISSALWAGSFATIDQGFHAMFLLQEVIKGIQEHHFSVLNTPNFCNWALSIESTYPELDIANKAGNAGIINFLRSWKYQYQLKRIAPNNSYLILSCQKVTQEIFEAL